MIDKKRVWPKWIGKVAQRKELNVMNPPKADKRTQCNSSDAYSRLILVEKLPKYTHTSDENFDSFLNIFTLHLKILHVDEKDKVSLLLACLNGNALDKLIHQPIPINEKTTWEETTQYLQNIFCSNNFPTIQTLRQLKQHDQQSLESFADITQQLVNNLFLDADGYNDQQRENESIRYFVRGVNKTVKNQLKRNRYGSIQEMLTKAQQIQNTIIVKRQHPT